jgi:hypothetical protein
MRKEIDFLACGSTCGSEDFAADDIAVDKRGEVTSRLYSRSRRSTFPGSQRQSRVHALQGLYSIQLIAIDALFSRMCKARCLLIKGTDGFHRCLLVLIDRRGQPVADEMGPSSPILLFEAKADRGVLCASGRKLSTTAFSSRSILGGLSMGFSLVAKGLAHAYLPDELWRPLLDNFGYSVGFLIVVLGWQQLFTENTLTVRHRLL